MEGVPEKPTSKEPVDDVSDETFDEYADDGIIESEDDGVIEESGATITTIDTEKGGISVFDGGEGNVVILEGSTTLQEEGEDRGEEDGIEVSCVLHDEGDDVRLINDSDVDEELGLLDNNDLSE
jgi:hypothetical protein